MNHQVNEAETKLQDSSYHGERRHWNFEKYVQMHQDDRIPSTTPGAESPRDAKDSGSARSHSTHLETSSSNRS